GAGGGRGGGALQSITSGWGGTIKVVTNTGGNATGGSITAAAGTLLDAGTGTVSLATPAGGASGIGTAGANIQTSAGTVTAAAGSGGGFVTGTERAELHPPPAGRG